MQTTYSKKKKIILRKTIEQFFYKCKAFQDIQAQKLLYGKKQSVEDLKHKSRNLLIYGQVNQLINNQIIQYLMSASSAELFFQIAQKVQNKQYYQELIAYQNQFFDLQPYKIDKLYAETAKKIYKQILAKYSYTRQFTVDSNSWHQNQRKLFIWFIIVAQTHSQQFIWLAQNQINWNILSDAFFMKNPDFLKFQFLNIIKNKKRINWTQSQDKLLTKITNELGPGKWNDISKFIFYQSHGTVFRTPKHCRERWLNHLDQNKNKGKWTPQQDLRICKYVLENGKRWSKLVPILQNKRTQHMIKNRFNSLLTKKKKNKKQKQEEIIKKIIFSLEQMPQLKINSQEDFQDFNGKCSKCKYQQKQLKQTNMLKQQAQNLEQFQKIFPKKISFQIIEKSETDEKNEKQQFIFFNNLSESMKICSSLTNFSAIQEVNQLSWNKMRLGNLNCQSYSSFALTTDLEIQQRIQVQEYRSQNTFINVNCESSTLFNLNPNNRSVNNSNVKAKFSPIYIIKGNICNSI